MSTTTSITIRIDTTVKKQAQDLFASMGLDMTAAIEAFLRTSVEGRKLPFDMPPAAAPAPEEKPRKQPEKYIGYASFSELREEDGASA
ncbi:MAG: type II toxin-antitoxin system RelB/DinJ family antitoxin [Desulfovibrionaceae bacterium]|nr:type II toxin-antitoxin system RelB/DinJ family antitoxin [Desulfovibrionaceae bacterium]